MIERAKSKPLDENAPAKERVNPATLGYYPVKMEVEGLLKDFRAPTGPMSYNQPMIEQIYLNHGFVVFRYASDHTLTECEKALRKLAEENVLEAIFNGDMSNENRKDLGRVQAKLPNGKQFPGEGILNWIIPFGESGTSSQGCTSQL